MNGKKFDEPKRKKTITKYKGLVRSVQNRNKKNTRVGT